MSKQWDILTKMLMQANPQDLVSWILTDAVYRGEQNVELQKKDPISADLLYNIEKKGSKLWSTFWKNPGPIRRWFKRAW